MSLNRVVALFAPVFAAAGAVGSAWLLKHVPGLPAPSAAELAAVEATTAAAAAGAALKWLHGHQAWEARAHSAEQWAAMAARDVEDAAPVTKTDIEDVIRDLLPSLIAAKTPVAPHVSDAEEFAHQPPAPAPAPEAPPAAAPAPPAPVAA